MKTWQSIVSYSIIIVLVYLQNSLLGAEVQETLPFARVQPDQDCGPKCIHSLISITGKSEIDLDVEDIYKMIGKDPSMPTTLYDLKMVLDRIGYSVEGRKLTLDKLTNDGAYAIIPVGDKQGTKDDPMHFILVTHVKKEYAIVINPNTLGYEIVPRGALAKSWDGRSLLITKYHGQPINKESIDNKIPKTVGGTKRYDEIRDFGVIDLGANLTYAFKVRNSKGQQVKVIKKSCSCAEADLSKGEDGETSLVVSFHAEKPGFQEAQVVLLLTPKEEIRRYCVRAIARNSFHVVPVVGYLPITENKSYEYPVVLAYTTDAKNPVSFEGIEKKGVDFSVGSIKHTKSKVADAVTHMFHIPMILEIENLHNTNQQRSVRKKIEFILNTETGKCLIPYEIILSYGKDKYEVTPKSLVFLVPRPFPGFVQRKTLQIHFKEPFIPNGIDVVCDDVLSFDIQNTSEKQGQYMIDVGFNTKITETCKVGEVYHSLLTIHPRDLAGYESVKIPITLAFAP